MTTTTSYEQLGELYLETLCQNAYYGGAAGTIRDAVLTAAGCGGPADGPDLLRAAQKLTLDAMGFLERSIGQVSTDWLRNQCDWARIDAFWDATERSIRYPYGDYCPEGTETEIEAAQAECRWVIEQLDLQADRAWKTYFEHAGKPITNLGIRWHHDLALAATFLQAAALLLKEVQCDA